MNSLKILIKRYANTCVDQAAIDEADLDGNEAAQALVREAWHALELRLIELEAYLEGVNQVGGMLGHPLLLIRGGNGGRPA